MGVQVCLVTLLASTHASLGLRSETTRGHDHLINEELLDAERVCLVLALLVEFAVEEAEKFAFFFPKTLQVILHFDWSDVLLGAALLVLLILVALAATQMGSTLVKCS